jgi:hypothetical protein
MKTYFGIIIALCLIWPAVSRAAEPVEVYYFSDPQCSACGDMEYSLAQMKKSYPEMRVVNFDVSTGNEVALILQDLFSIYEPDELQLPAVFIGSQVFTGYNADVVSGIGQTIDTCRTSGCKPPSSILRDFYAQIDKKQQSQAKFPILLFWAIFIVIWPIIGGIAIIIVLKKHSKHLMKTRMPQISKQG